MQWLQDPSQSNVDHLNNVRREASSANYIQNFIQHLAVKVNSMCGGNYWES